MPKRILKGKIIKNKTDKTVIVDVESTYMHKKYAVHDENNLGKVGDLVEIIESKPISKTKKFILLNDEKKSVKASKW